MDEHEVLDKYEKSVSKHFIASECKIGKGREKMSTKYFIGTAGWSYTDWSPMFYPQKQGAGFDKLSFYSKYFNCVEVNSTYYQYHHPGTALEWLKKTEGREDFHFTIKLHQDFTHKREYLKENIDSVRSLLNVLQRGERFGGLLIQFPYSFSFSPVSAGYLLNLSDEFCGYRKFLEVRHKSWSSAEAYDFCKEWGLVPATIDQPQIGETIPFRLNIVNERAYIRLHGRNDEGWLNSIRNYGKQQSYQEQNERYRYLYSSGELTEIAQIIKSATEHLKEVFVIFNNHPGGNAPANALELIHFLENRQLIDIPAQMGKYFQPLKSYSNFLEQELF
ncbi:MAG: DUF72 domain-containing protein [Ignavibacteriales bacterium]|nr:MAG: DUF72 domain-containing protein [Ignavibacteriaceae bacterium]MBW7871832.1 DUF72 domain-containing protein [Ignavibacteria bacterium]MCZ2144318.1 DUF72 domain-containing protein [Ignavibacteriales bacterium]OQY75981.1 MAG: hypothetical protein B6D45_04780 [Ignavibacteriales bacterium UTCHB3]MBV6446271.1 hypothetical protein [Ignavibacteriaceae bacterium]